MFVKCEMKEYVSVNARKVIDDQRWNYHQCYVYIFQVSVHSFYVFSIPKVIFHNILDLENLDVKFHNSPGLSRICTNLNTALIRVTMQHSVLKDILKILLKWHVFSLLPMLTK